MLERRPGEDQGTTGGVEQRTYQPITHIVSRPGIPFSYVPIFDPDRVRALEPRFADSDSDVGTTADVITFEVPGTSITGAITLVEIETVVERDVNFSSAFPAGVARNYEIDPWMESPNEVDLKRLKLSINWRGKVYKLDADFEDISKPDEEPYFADQSKDWISEENGQPYSLLTFPARILPEVIYQVDLEDSPEINQQVSRALDNNQSTTNPPELHSARQPGGMNRLKPNLQLPDFFTDTFPNFYEETFRLD